MIFMFILVKIKILSCFIPHNNEKIVYGALNLNQLIPKLMQFFIIDLSAGNAFRAVTWV